MRSRLIVLVVASLLSQAAAAVDCSTVDLVLTTESATHELGDPLYFEVAFVNSGPDAVHVPSIPFPPSRHVVLTDANGQAIVRRENCGQFGTIVSSYQAVRLEPGQAFAVVAALADSHLITQPGDYLLSVRVPQLTDPSQYSDDQDVTVPDGLMCTQLAWTSEASLSLVEGDAEVSAAFQAYITARGALRCAERGIAGDIAANHGGTVLADYLALRAIRGAEAHDGSLNWATAHAGSSLLKPILLQSLRLSIVRENRERGEGIVAQLSGLGGWPAMTESWLLSELAKVPFYVEESE